jgi:ABC-2 type transport system permease protein
MIYLEGHRQNSANFGDVRQSSFLLRFGQLTPALVLQILAPLVLIFMGFNSVVRERELGMLRLLQMSGVALTRLVWAKALALLVVVGIMLMPLAAALLYLGLFAHAGVINSLLMFGSYALYLCAWLVLVLIVSTISQRSNTALLSLLSIWIVVVIILPRLAGSVGQYLYTLPNKSTTDFVINQQLQKMGDLHNPDDPYFNQFKAATLHKYGVRQIEDLPFNYKGYLAIHGEKLQAVLFDRFATAQFNILFRQNALTEGLLLYNPYTSVQRLSMALSNTDIHNHLNFVTQAEVYRFTMVQQLNRLQMHQLTYADDTNRNKDPEAAKRVRVNAKLWQQIPNFEPQPLPVATTYQQALKYIMAILAWLALGVLALIYFTNKLNREKW